MKFISFRQGGTARWGVLRDDGAVIDLSDAGFGSTLRQAIAADLLGAAGTRAEQETPAGQVEDVELDSPLPDAGKLLAVGANYSDHAAEMNRDVGGDPQFFIRLPSSVVAHGAPILKPFVSDHLDYEGELAIVIGKPGRHIAIEDAKDHIAGYTIFNDGTVRDYQQVSLPVGKNFKASGSIGPWFVPAADISFPLTLETRVNGEVRQHNTTDNFTFGPARLIEYASRFTRLEPGDIIASGTPAGVGARRDPPAWLKAGDTLEVEISQIGILRNGIVNEPA
ncbi:fumarylacetoacetate hydrolase family protein [Sphingomonas sp. QA11]|uniref:fumarylacetoacetate hydrolase family protein n=1 Tax=Sphingomonas sp. QA11 TaxID=2950605 RepID=UPI00234A0B83|nr:fumarylacetoacetate hydrolase family protein [Sphingomonas sp. QA11]WCM28596.1 fumarylacetoacetate hydrolase family protein [Sphingomonas sp. QA11]